MPKTYIVVARTPSGGIGKRGELPWTNGDLAWFRRLTTETRDPTKINCVVVGQRTHKQMGGMLPNRLLCSVSRARGPTISQLLQEISEDSTKKIESVFFAGGTEVYAEALRFVDGMYVTEMHEDAEGCDAFFPPFDPAEFEEPLALPGSTSWYSLRYYARKPHPEQQYLNLLRECLLAPKRDDRTGMGTRSVFGRTMRFDLRGDRIPVFTTKRVFWRGVVAELLWFLNGETNSKKLAAQDVHIWDANGSKSFLDAQGLVGREEGELGPVYGHQWRFFGSSWPSTQGGVDQISYVLTQLRTNPTSRRMIVTAWNPLDLPKCALPPCHVLFQFWVESGELSCSMYQRSADMGLGVPFNVASYSLLVHIMARAARLRPGDFFHVMGDTHVYAEHEPAIREQLEREPRAFPTLRIATDNVDPFAYAPEDFELVGYAPHPPLKMKMAV